LSEVPRSRAAGHLILQKTFLPLVEDPAELWRGWGRIKVGVMIRSFPPHPNPLPCLRRSGFAQAGPRGEGRPFIPPAELGGILAYFDKRRYLLLR